MSYFTIENLLNKLVSDIPNMPPIEFDHGTLGICKGSSFIRITNFPAVTIESSLGNSGFNKYNGLYQISLFYPANQGSDALNYAADAIIAAIPQSIYTLDGINVRIVKRYQQRGAVDNNTYVQTIVMLQWESFIPRT